MKHNFVIIIPVRLKSTRLKNKPLIDICGKKMIERTFNRASSVIDKKKIFIVTDSFKIKNFCNNFTNNVLISSESCLTGTDRVAEIINKIDSKVYINLQGDEPIMPLKNIKLMVNSALSSPDEILNGYSEVHTESDYFNTSIPKLVFSQSKSLLYMSRSPIPGSKIGKFDKAYKQVCIYSFPKKSLKFFSKFKKKTNLEKIEDIEILRFLENDFKIKMIKMSPNNVAVDTKSDLQKVKDIILSQGEDLEEYNI